MILPDDVDGWTDELTRCVEDGRPLDLAPEKPAKIGEPDKWPAGRVIPVEAVRAVMTSPGTRIPRGGIEIRAAKFTEPFDLDYLRFDHRLQMSECVFERGFTARYAELRELDLTKVNVNGGIQAPGVVIKSRLDLSGAHVYHPGNVALDLHNARISGSALLKGAVDADGKVTRAFSSSGTIRLDGAKIEGHLTMTAAVLTAPADLRAFRSVESGCCAIFLDGAKVGGDMIAGRGFRAYGEVRGIGATVGGQLNMTGAQIRSKFTSKRPRAKVANPPGQCQAGCAEVVNPPSECEAGCSELSSPPAESTTGCAALTLDYAHIGTDVSAAKGFEAVGTISAVGSSIGGSLDLTGAKVTLPSGLEDQDRYALILDNARISLSVFAGIETGGTVSATGLTTGDQFGLAGAILRDGTSLGILILDGAKIGGDLYASDDKDSEGAALKPLAAFGEVRALRITIGGDLNLEGAVLNNPDDDALTLDNAHIGRHIYAQANFTANGTVRALGMTVDRNVYLNSAQLAKRTKNGGYGRALWLDDASIAGDLLAGFEEKSAPDKEESAIGTPPQQQNGDRKPFTVHGEVSARGINVGRDLDLSGATLVCPPTHENLTQYALQLDDSQVGGDFFARRREDAEKCVCHFDVTGAIRARGARVGGDLDLGGAIIKNEATGPDRETFAIDVEGMHVAGSVLAGEWGSAKLGPCEITGAFRANNLVVGDRFDLSGAKLSSGSAQMEESNHGQPSGNGQQQPSDSALTADSNQKWTLDLESATISYLSLTPAVFDGGVRLSRARINDLEADCGVGASYRPPPSPLTAIGWQVGDLQGPLREDWKTAHKWIDPDVKDHCRLARWTSWLHRKEPSIAVQPWFVLADVYERNGNPASARKLRVAAENKVTAQSPMPTRMIRALYCVVAAYGYYPLYAIASMIILVGVAAGAVWLGDAHIVLTDQAETARARAHPGLSLLQPVTAQTPCDERSDYPCIQHLTFAINSVLPPAAGNNTQWTIAPRGAVWLVIGLTAIKLALWALAALFLAGVTGLLRKSKT